MENKKTDINEQLNEALSDLGVASGVYEYSNKYANAELLSTIADICNEVGHIIQDKCGFISLDTNPLVSQTTTTVTCINEEGESAEASILQLEQISPVVPVSDAAYALSDYYLNVGKTLEIAEKQAGIYNGKYTPQGIIINEEQVSQRIIKFFDEEK